MGWSHSSIPPMRLEARFGDRMVPAFIERPVSIWAMIVEAAARNPDGEAIICGDRRLSWREVVAQSADIAAGFAKLGLVPGDRVAVLLGNRVEFVLTMFAAAHAGLVTVLLSVRQQKPEIAYVLTDCGAKILVHEAALEDRLPGARDVPELKHRVAVDDDAARSQFASLRGNASVLPPAKVGEEDTAMILYVGHDGQAEGCDARALQCHPFLDGVRVVPAAHGSRSLHRGRAARPCHGRRRQHHHHGPLRGCAHHHAGIQGGRISEARRARARHLHGDGAGDV